MRYYRVKTHQPEAITVVNMKSPEEVNRRYPEFVPSYWEWILPQEQVKIVNRLNEITKPDKLEN